VRILQFNNYADPIGGAEVYALALTHELGRRGHEVAFFGTSPDREADEERLRVVRRPRYDVGVLFHDPAVRGALGSFIERFRPELLHVHNVSSLGVDVLELLGATRLPILQTVHDFSLLCPNSWCVRGDGTPCAGGVGAQCFRYDCQKNYPYDPEVALHTLLKQRTLVGIVDLAICPSLYLAQRLRESGFRDVRHLNYFIEPIDAGAPSERREKELVFIGRLEPEKGVECLLEAMSAVHRGDPEVHLTIVGGGTQSDALAARAEALGLGGAVTFLSHLPRAELGRIYASATACVLPSIWSENSPLVAYECLAAGLPMIASRSGGLPELVEEGPAGFTFTPRDARDLAEKALRLLALPAGERARMSASMRERARGFQAGPHVARIEELYGEVARAGPGARNPAVPVDAELFAVLREYGRERARLGGVFHEHVGHIRHLERSLAENREHAQALEQHAQALEQNVQVLERSVSELRRKLPREILRRLVRRLLPTLRS
jgi:glycosyltransferase involved in cell wall biosynthesis